MRILWPILCVHIVFEEGTRVKHEHSELQGQCLAVTDCMNKDMNEVLLSESV